MENTLAIIKGAESQLTTVRDQLASIREPEHLDKVQDILKSCKDIADEIHRRKLELLKNIVPLANLLPKKNYYISYGRCHTYIIKSATEIDITPGEVEWSSPDLRGTYTLERFVGTSGVWFSHFCRSMLVAIENALQNSPVELRRKLAEVVSLEQSLTSLPCE